MHSPQSDRRGKPRVNAGLAAQFSNEMGEEAMAAETMNLSMSGVCCQLPNPVEPLTKVKLTLLVPEVKGKRSARTAVVCAEGIVVRCESQASGQDAERYEIACAFTSLRDKDRKILQAYVDNRLGELSPRDGPVRSQTADLRRPE
jgi:hypothetical protein